MSAGIYQSPARIVIVTRLLQQLQLPAAQAHILSVSHNSQVMISMRYIYKATMQCHNDEYFMLVDKLHVVILAITACNLIHGNQ